jgi:hyperosmotically inducible protein
MKTRILAPLLLAGLLVGCSSTPPPAPDVKDGVRAALDSRGLKDVTVSQDRDKGVVTLSGKVATEAAKAEAASVAQTIAGPQVVANEIVVTPSGMEDAASDINAAVDDGIESNMKALLIKMGGKDDVSYDSKAGVVTLTGTVSSQARRTEIEKAAAAVANVKQVVNEIEVTNQKATSSGSGS